MAFRISFIFLALALVLPLPLPARDEGPPIVIKSPDAGSTYVYGSIKNRALIWDKGHQMLIARVVFTDSQQSIGQPQDDTHEFRLPGVTFDAAQGLFFAKTAKGESIPVARMKKVLFINTIESTPNAVVRIQREQGNVTVILEAISMDDPLMHLKQPDKPDGTHNVDINKVIN